MRCEAEITEKCLIPALKNIPNGKSPGHNSLAIEFYKNCWVDLKFYFMKFLKQSKIDGDLPISQK